MREITGTVANVIYESADGYTVAEIEGDEPTVVVGNMPGLRIGEVTRFFGDFKNHQKFGLQFAVSSYESALPADLNDIVLFLGGGFIKGLGEVLAGRIVEEFGEETFDVIENNYMRLASVKGVSKKLAQSVHAAFAEYAQKKYVYSELMGIGLTAHQANIIEAELGVKAAATIKENPYLLIERVNGVDFITADKIAKKLGVEKDSPFRISHGIMNVLNKMLAAGNMYVMRDRLEPHVAEKLGIERNKVKRMLLEMCAGGKAVMRRYGQDHQVVFPINAYRAETRAAAKLFEMSRTEADKQVDGLEKKLAEQKKLLGLTEEQVFAVKAAVSNRICVLTGGPGTGKTTILKAILNVLGSAGISCALAAPTGRAAKRMNEATGEEAKTLHRLLEYSYDEDAFQCYFNRNEDNPLEQDTVIVDEVSMLDIFLMNNLLRAVKDGARLVLVGDADQLPSVGPGNVMRDLLMSGAVAQVRLTYRFRNAGRIADAAHEILQGEMPEPDDEEFVMVECGSRCDVVEKVREEYLKCWRQGSDVQVIAPIKRTEAGTVALNSVIRDTVNPAKAGKAEMMFGDRLFRVGDRVMQIKNNYAREWRNYEELSVGEGVFNGDIGTIRDIKAGSVYVLFEDGKNCEYKTTELNELDGAFAYTIHKSQGSEFDIVIIPMLYEPNPFFTRNLLYTAVTRAKKKVVLIGDSYTLSYMVKNGAKGRRATSLAKELKYFLRIAELGGTGGNA